MARRTYYLIGYLVVTTLLTLGGLAMNPPEAPPWESGEVPPAEGGTDDLLTDGPPEVEDELSNVQRQYSRPAFA